MKHLVVAVFAFVGLAATAAADPIGGPNNTNCNNNSCQGSTYTLTNLGQLADVDPTHELWRVQLSIDTSTYTGTGVAIDSVAIKVASAANLNFAGSSLFAAPGGTGNWAFFNTGLNNGNGSCSGGSNGFVCTSHTGNGVAVGGTLDWVFDISVANGGLFENLFEASIKAMYVNASGGKVGAIVSEKITLQDGDITVPEPATLLLMALGLLAMTVVRRRQ